MSALFTAGLLAALAATPVSAFWRTPCKSPIVVERADPIISPGAVSNHLHTIMGGNGFDFTMDYNSTQASTCSSCTVVGDNSNYWTPALFFQHQNGTFESVDQVGGSTVYYLQRGGDGEKIKAFPPGFRMVAGNPFKRAAGNDFASQAISYNCLDYSGGKPETPNFPNYNCPDGLRAQVFFPSCWNGKDLDSANHMSHMSYPANSYNSGSCPPDFPVHLVSIFFEVIWDTGKFSNQWYGNTQPFIWSQGDPTGYGGHGDFVMGWEESHLQDAVDQCTSDSGRVEDCPVFDLIPDSQAEGCRIQPQVNEPVSGVLDALPGCNPVQPGPVAKPQSGCGAPTTTSPSNATFFTDITSKGWSYVGCGTDNYYSRALTGTSQSNDQMTNEACAAFCDSKGFSFAGTEYSRECYCGNSIPDSGKPVPGVVGDCTMTCSGDESEFCGGSGKISLYQKCSGGSCTNAQVGPGSSAPIQVANPPAGSSAPSAASSVAYTAPSSPTTLATVTTTKAAATPDSTPSTPVSPEQPASSVPASSASAPASSPTATSSLSAPASSPTAASSPATPPSTSNPSWSYSGCYTDTVFPRTLPKWSDYNGDHVTNDNCVSFCDARGYPVAGTEYSGQCFCGAEINSTQLGEDSCNMACTGDAGQTCGGPGALSVWTKSSSSKKVKRHLHGLNKHGKRHSHI